MSEQPKAKGRRPDYRLYTVTGEGKDVWTTVGAAWSNPSGKGLTLSLKSYGRIVMLPSRARQPDEGGQTVATQELLLSSE